MTNDDCKLILRMMLEEYKNDIHLLTGLILSEQTKNVSVGRLNERKAALEHALNQIR